MFTSKECGDTPDDKSVKVTNRLQNRPAIYDVINRYCEKEARNAPGLQCLEADRGGGDPKENAKRFLMRGSADEISIHSTLMAPVLEILGLTNPPDKELEEQGVERINFSDDTDDFAEMTTDERIVDHERHIKNDEMGGVHLI